MWEEKTKSAEMIFLIEIISVFVSSDSISGNEEKNDNCLPN